MTQLMLLMNKQASPTAADRRDAEHRRAAMTPVERRVPRPADGIVIRSLGDADRDEIARLAEVDSAQAPAGSAILGAEIGGRLMAALSLEDGRLVADPFRPTAAAIELLRLRAAQLGAVADARPGRLRRILEALRRGHAHAGLAGSPPGAGGRLLEL